MLFTVIQVNKILFAEFLATFWSLPVALTYLPKVSVRGQLKYDGTRAETRFRLSANRMSPFKSAGASVQSTTGSQVVRISASNAGYNIFRGSVKSIGYTLNSPVSPSFPLPCVTVCHHISTEVYLPQVRPSVCPHVLARLPLVRFP